MKRLVEFAKKESLVLVVVGLYLWAGVVSPDRALMAARVSFATLAEVALIIFSVFLALGLFGVLVDKQAIGKRLGEGSGIKALLLAAGFGTILVGPVYAVFPLLKAFKDHGARPAVIVTVITAWAVKLPMLPLEVRFLGGTFAAARVVLTLVSAVALGLLMEQLLQPVARRRVTADAAVVEQAVSEAS